MAMHRTAALAALTVLIASGDAKAFDPGTWDCENVTRDGVEIYACRECGSPQPEAEGLQICQVYDFPVGVEAFQRDETELVIIVTPYLVRPAPAAAWLRPPDRFELRRASETKPPAQ